MSVRDLRTRLRQPYYTAARREAYLAGGLWATVLAAGLTDVALTIVGLRLGYAESNPFGAALLAMGGPALLLAGKLLIVGTFFALVRMAPPLVEYAAAGTLALCWTVVVGYNLAAVVVILG